MPVTEQREQRRKAAAEQRRVELLAIGRRAVARNACPTVTVAPDHTSEDNYHLCTGSKRCTGPHYCGCGHTWSA